jgi:hypothetical protein
MDRLDNSDDGDFYNARRRHLLSQEQRKLVPPTRIFKFDNDEIDEAR